MRREGRGLRNGNLRADSGGEKVVSWGSDIESNIVRRRGIEAKLTGVGEQLENSGGSNRVGMCLPM